MAKSVDYYKLLGVSIFASEGEIRNAYLAKIKMLRLSWWSWWSSDNRE